MSNRHHPDRIDWMLADIQGEVRDLNWYLDKAESGDRDAALRAIEGIVRSLSPEALAQCGGSPPNMVLNAVLRVLAPAVSSGDSKVLRAARKASNPDVERNARMWWWCVRLHLHLKSNPDVSHVDAAAVVLSDDPPDGKLPDAATVAKRYQQLHEVIERYFEDGMPTG